MAQLIHGYLQRLAAPWAMFNVMPGLCGIRGGEGSRNRIGTQLKCPAAILAPPRKRGHQRLLCLSNIHKFSGNANAFGNRFDMMSMRPQRMTRCRMRMSIRPQPGPRPGTLSRDGDRRSGADRTSPTHPGIDDGHRTASRRNLQGGTAALPSDWLKQDNNYPDFLTTRREDATIASLTGVILRCMINFGPDAGRPGSTASRKEHTHVV